MKKDNILLLHSKHTFSTVLVIDSYIYNIAIMLGYINTHAYTAIRPLFSGTQFIYVYLWLNVTKLECDATEENLIKQNGKKKKNSQLQYIKDIA